MFYILYFILLNEFCLEASSTILCIVISAVVISIYGDIQISLNE